MSKVKIVPFSESEEEILLRAYRVLSSLAVVLDRDDLNELASALRGLADRIHRTDHVLLNDPKETPKERKP